MNISLEGEGGSTDSTIMKREKAMVSLMQDDDMRKAAENLFKRMSVIPASRLVFCIFEITICFLDIK